MNWNKDCEQASGCGPVALMTIEHGESYTRDEWTALSDAERAAAWSRRERFNGVR